MKKKLLAAVLAGVMVLSAVGCGSSKEYRAEDMSKYIELGEYTGFEVEMDTEVTEEEIQQEIAYICENAKEYEQITEGTIAEGNIVNIDYTGVLEGETEGFEGGTDSDFNLEIGSNSFIDNFEDQLIGCKVGETVVVTVTFPGDYGVEDLNGKVANFTVIINYICGAEIIPEWTDEFVAKFSEGAYTTTKDYEAYLKDYYTEAKLEAAESNKQTEVIAKIIENSKVVKYDQEEVDAYYDDCINYYTTMAETYYGCELGEFVQNMMGQTEEEFLADAADAAYQYVVGNLALLAIAYEEGLSITEEEYEEKLDDLTEEYGYDDPSQVEEECAEYGETYLWDEFLREKALEFVLDTVEEI